MPLWILGAVLLFSLCGELAYIRADSGRFSFVFLRCAACYRRAAAVLLLTALTLMLTATDLLAPLHFSLPQAAVATLAACFFSFISLLLRLHRRTPSGRTSATVALVGILAAALFCEAVICNFRAWESMAYVPTDLTEEAVLTNAVPDANKDGFYKMLHPEKSLFITCKELDGLPIRNVYIELEAYYEGIPVQRFTVTPTFADGGNALSYPTVSKDIMQTHPTDRYIPLNPSGPCTYLRVEISNTAMDEVRLVALRVDEPRPFFFSPVRFAAVLAVLILAYLLRPKSPLYRATLAPFTPAKKTLTLLCGGTLALICLLIMSHRSGFLQLMAAHQAQYQELADAFLNGHLHLFRETPPAFLAEMDNPYDTFLRQSLEAEYGQPVYWDAAYFNGNYYVYFGILPCLLLYLPYRVLTGKDLPNDIAILIFLVMLIAAVFFLVYELLCRFSRAERIPFLTYLILSCLVLTAAGIFALATTPDLYSVPITAGLAFAALGIALWLYAMRDESKIRALPLFFGSLSVAAVAACRPQLLLLAAAMIPLFMACIFRRRTLFSRTSVKETLALVLPFVMVALPLMWYNAARFGSPFDFGANYNLTTNDMTLRGLAFERGIEAVFYYFLQLPRIIPVYPFLRYCDMDTLFRGVTVWEPTYGGLLAVCPFALLGLLLLFSRRNAMKKQRSYLPALIFLVTGVVIAMFDAMAAGVLQRYFADFSLPVLLGATLAFADAAAAARGARRLRLRGVLLACLAVTCLYQLCLYLVSTDSLRYLYQFWD